MVVILLIAIKRDEIDHVEIKYFDLLFEKIFWLVGNYFASVC